MALALKPDRPDTTIEKNRLAALAVKGCLSCLIVYSQILSGCAATNRPPEPAPYPVAMSADVIAREVTETEKALSRLPEKATKNNKKAELLLRLAMLYAHPDRPNPDYHRAIDYLKQYAALEKTVHSGYALSLLTRLSECVSDKNAACAVVMRQKDELETQYQDLFQENLYHKQIIEKLKSLDIQLEKRRKSFE